MKDIVGTIDQPGVGTYPVSISQIAEGQRKELSGFIYLNTQGFESLTFVTLTSTIQVQDMAGHYSHPVTFRLLLTGTGQQESPPAGGFEETNLGPIMSRLRTIQR